MLDVANCVQQNGGAEEEIANSIAATSHFVAFLVGSEHRQGRLREAFFKRLGTEREVPSVFNNVIS